MDNDSSADAGEPALFAGAAWFDPIEAGLRGRIRGFIEELVEQELTEALGRRRHERGGVAGHRHGHRERRLTGSFGPVEIRFVAEANGDPAPSGGPRTRTTSSPQHGVGTKR